MKQVDQSSSTCRCHEVTISSLMTSFSRPTLWAITLVIIIISGSGMIRSDSTKTLSVQSLNIESADGKVKFRLAVNQDGSPEFRMFDNEGRDRILMQVDSEGIPSVRIMQRDGKSGIYMATDVMGGSVIEVGDSEQQSNVNIHSLRTGQSFMVISNAEQKQRARFGITDSGHTVMSLLDSNENARLNLQSTDEGSFMTVKSEDGVNRALFGLDKNQTAILEIADTKGKSSAFVRNGPTLTPGFFLYNDTDGEVFSATPRNRSSVLFMRDYGLGLTMALGNLGEGSMGGAIVSTKNAQDRLLLRSNQSESSLRLISPNGVNGVEIQASDRDKKGNEKDGLEKAVTINR
jgi:hypothetical protein